MIVASISDLFFQALFFSLALLHFRHYFHFFNDYPLSGGPELAVSMFMLFGNPGASLAGETCHRNPRLLGFGTGK